MATLTKAHVLEADSAGFRDASLIAMKARRSERDLARLRTLLDGRTDDWLAFADRNQIQPLAAWTLLEAYGAQHASAPGWRRIYDQSEDYVQTLMSQLDQLAERFDREGIRLVALKNAGIARGIYPHAGCCPMGDIDTLVARDRLRDAHQLALELGFEHASRAPTVEPADLEQALVSGGAEYRKEVGGHVVWLEVQWRPIAGRWIPRAAEPDGAALLARSVAIDGTKVRLLAPTDNMLQVALHTAKHSYCRAPGLRLHTDVDRLAAAQPPDWEELARMAGELGLSTAVYLSLAIAEALLESSVPHTVLRQLAPPRWKRDLLCRWLRSVDIFEPTQRKFSRPAMLVFHSLLYDDLTTFRTSLAGTARRTALRSLPAEISAGAARLSDVLFRYER